MKLKVYLSFVIDLGEAFEVLPLDKIAENIRDDSHLWDYLGEGHPVYAKKCVVGKLEDIND